MNQIMCIDCTHPAHRTECEVELADEFVDGNNSGALVAQGPCGCSGCAGDVENPEEELGEQAQILGIWAASAAFSLSFWWTAWHWVGPVVAKLL